MRGITSYAKALVVVSAATVLAGCGNQSPPSTSGVSPSAAPVAGVVTLTASDCSLAPAPAPVKAGLVAFTLENMSAVKAGIDIWLMTDDKAFDRLVADAVVDRRLAEAGEPSRGDHAWLGDAPQLRIQSDSSAAKTVSAVLKSGSYAVVCIKSYPKVSEPRLLKVVGPVFIVPA